MQRAKRCWCCVMLKQRQSTDSASGFSITELMVACALSGLLIAAVSTYAAQSHNDLASLQHATSIEEDMRAVQSTISRHLSRAGFIQDTNVLTPFISLQNNNNGLSNVAISQRVGEPPNSCITFSYDKSGDGLISVSQGEFFGYRLHDKAIEYRVGGKTCLQGGWFDLTDPQTVKVTQFSANLLHQSSWGAAYEIVIALKSAINPVVESEEKFVIEVANDG